MSGRLSRRRRFAYAAVAAAGGLLLLECVLRLSGLGAPATVGTLRFGYRTGIPIADEDGIEREGELADVPICETDPLLWWRPIAGNAFTGAEGLRRPVPASRGKPAGTYRIAVLGDSCSFLGERLWPSRFAALAAAHRGGPVDVVNASCPGYTSFQGARRLAEVWPWKPDLLVVSFGWNDHWRAAGGLADAELAARAPAPTPRFLRASRIYGVLAALLTRAPEPATTAGPVRVPEADYARNLETIAADAAARGCAVVFVTAPTAFVEGRMPVWAYPVFRRYYGMMREQTRAVPRTHAAYNAIVRRVANTRDGVHLLDLAGQWESAPAVARFRRDCIHFSERGHDEAGRALFGLWRDVGLDTPR